MTPADVESVVWILPPDPLPDVAPLSPLSPSRGIPDSTVRPIAEHVDLPDAGLEGFLGEHLDSLVVLAHWREWLLVQYAPVTVKLYWQCIIRFLAAEPLPVEQVEPEHIARFLASYSYRSSARRTYYQALHCFFAWAERAGYVDRDPTRGLKVPAVVEKIPRALTETEYEKVVAAALERDPRRAFAIRFLYHTGARLTEAISVEWADVGPEEMVLRHTKGGKERAIPITPSLAEVLDGLRTYFGDYPLVLPRSGQTVWKWVREAGRDAGVDRVHPHLLRSTAATRMLLRGARPHAVRQFLGHVNIRTTQRYWAVEKEDVHNAAMVL